MEKYHTVAPDTDFCISGKPQTDDRDYMLRDVTRTQGMQEVKKGNLDVLVQIQSFDEIDTITDNFKVTMFFIKKEKKNPMKSHLFRMKYLLAGIYIICVVFTCFNARFYHTPLAKISSVTEKETMSRKGTRDAEEYYYTQKITARILNGTHKGEEISISNEYTTSQVQNQKYHRGDTVLLSGSRENPGKSIRSVKRDGYLALLAGGLFFF